MTSTAWAHLPNAVHIDRVIASAKASPSSWNTPLSLEDEATQMRIDVYSAIKNQGRKSEWDSVWPTLLNASLYSATALLRASLYPATAGTLVTVGVILALIAYDDCAYMLDSSPDDIAMLAMLGDTKAVLLLHACKVFHSINSEETV